MNYSDPTRVSVNIHSFSRSSFLDNFTSNDSNSCVILDDNSKGEEMTSKTMNNTAPVTTIVDDDDDCQCVDITDS